MHTPRIGRDQDVGRRGGVGRGDTDLGQRGYTECVQIRDSDSQRLSCHHPPFTPLTTVSGNGSPRHARATVWLPGRDAVIAGTLVEAMCGVMMTLAMLRSGCPRESGLRVAHVQAGAAELARTQCLDDSPVSTTSPRATLISRALRLHLTQGVAVDQTAGCSGRGAVQRHHVGAAPLDRHASRRCHKPRYSGNDRRRFSLPC